MITFREFLIEEDVVTNKRQGIEHFHKMKPLAFIEWANSIKKEFGGKLKGIKTTMKLDGLSLRFGKSSTGQIFIEGARTGPVFEPKTFSNYAASKSADEVVLQRAKHYDDMLEFFQKKAPFMKGIPNNTKINCEMFYNPMAEADETGIKFVTVKYDKNKLGTLMTIAPYAVTVASTGEAHPQEDEIIKSLYRASNDKIKFISPDLTMGTIDINALIDPLSVISKTSIDILNSRKKVDKEEKDNLLRLIQQVKDQITEYVMFHPNIAGLDKLCDPQDNEGICLHFPDKGIYKMTSKKYQTSHSAQKG